MKAGHTQPIKGARDRVAIYLLSSVLLAVAILFCVIVTIQVSTKGYVTVGPYSMFRVVTGSMEPEIPTGALLLCKDADVGEISEGDIVCYQSKAPEMQGMVITHRVVSVRTDHSGAVLLETRGDANFSSDPYYADDSNLIGRVVWYAGRENILTNVLSFLTEKTGFFVCIVLPTLLAAGFILQNAVKNLRRDLALARYALERGPVTGEDSLTEEDLLPGYTTLTYADYEEIYQALKKDLMEEENGHSKEDKEDKTTKYTK